MWYRAGSVTVTNGSPNVVGAGTDFVSNTQVGEAYIGPDGLSYEIAQVVSATQLVLADNYRGASGGGQGYKIQPTSSFARDLALGAAQLLNTFGAVRDGVGQGLFGDGTIAAPALRFAADQDTGLRRAGDNLIALVAAGLDRLVVGPGGVGFGTANPQSAADLVGHLAIRGTGSNTGPRDLNGICAGTATYTSPPVIVFRVEGGTNLDDNITTIFRRVANGVASEAMRIDASGNLLVGVSGGPNHIILRLTDQGGEVLRIGGSYANPTAFFSSVGAFSPSSAATALFLGQNSTTGRSVNAGGTINASGADYAEYMTKSDDCGTIAAGDVCGVDADGHLTKTWADAISFVVKSTDPAYVGGDTWAAHLAARPEQVAEEDEATFAARLAVWDAALEAARQRVDRVAFCGQVPVNVSGDFAVGDYLIPVASGAGIKAVAVAEAAITFDQYRRRIGKVWAVRNGRAWVDVQHG